MEITIPVIDPFPRPVVDLFSDEGRFDETGTVGRGATTLLPDTVETSTFLHCVAPAGSEIEVNIVKMYG